jgi:axial budding pattern protein 2
VLDDGNGASPERGGGDGDHLRIVEGKGKRPVSREVREELKTGASRKGRMTTWGSLKAVMARGYWEGRDKDMKAFL